LLIHIDSYHEFKNEKHICHLKIHGKISAFRGTMVEPLATIEFQDQTHIYTHNPIEAFLERYGKPADDVTIYENGGNIINIPNEEPLYAPSENVTYSISSGDYNPIHTNQYIADLAGDYNFKLKNSFF
jgi:hypothetical protein